MTRAIELNDGLWTSAHGCDALFVAGFFRLDGEFVVRSARRTARRLGLAAGSVS